MQYENSIRDFDRVNRAVGIAALVFYDFKHTRRPETAQRLCLRMLAADLGEIQPLPEHVDHLFGQGKQILIRTAYPVNRFDRALDHKIVLYTNGY